jgi:REP element-mobilizing transposase RayT
MPRQSRTVFAGIPHHITQRGNRREDIFLANKYPEAYLTWLREYSGKFDVEILANCLMTNHIHLVAVADADREIGVVHAKLHGDSECCFLAAAPLGKGFRKADVGENSEHVRQCSDWPRT